MPPDRVSLLGLRLSQWLSERQVDWLVFATTLALALPAVLHAARTGRLLLSLMVLPFATVPLLWRRSHPTIVLVILAVTLGVSAVGGRSFPSNVGVLFGLYSAALYGGERLRAISGVVAVTASVAGFVMLLASQRARLIPHLSAAVVFGAAAAWILGEAVRTRQAYLGELEDRTARLEHERDQHARRAAQEERIRIARDLHDLVAHHVSVIAVQAGAARSTSRSKPDRALSALPVIERTARGALSELRALVGVLRADDEAGQLPPLRPQPSIRELDELVGTATAAGISVDWRVEGTPVVLDPLLELAAYRVVQEALTNVVKHAPGARATLLISYDDASLRIEVSDDGPGCVEPQSAGHGLIGMRERVELAGGRLEVGTGDGHGFRIRASLPVNRSGDRKRMRSIEPEQERQPLGA